MTFKKLALASAIALVPVAGISAEALDDATLSGVTGQDGISIDISTPAIAPTALHVYDRGGFTGATDDGVIVISGMTYSGAMGIDIDAGSNGTSAPTLNIAISIPSATINTGSISVAGTTAANAWTLGSQSATLMSSMTINLANAAINIQLANEVQGSMIDASMSLTSGLSISNFALNDIDSGGSIAVGTILVHNNADTTALGLAFTADVDNTGLQVTLGGFGNGGGADVYMTDVKLGTSTNQPIGDVALIGLGLAGTTVTIAGK